MIPCWDQWMLNSGHGAIGPPPLLDVSSITHLTSHWPNDTCIYTHNTHVPLSSITLSYSSISTSLLSSSIYTSHQYSTSNLRCHWGCRPSLFMMCLDTSSALLLPRWWSWCYCCTYSAKQYPRMRLGTSVKIRANRCVFFLNLLLHSVSQKKASYASSGGVDQGMHGSLSCGNGTRTVAHDTC